MKGRVFVFSGPSGAGKSSITKGLVNRLAGLAYSVSHTSRRPRKDEEHGKDYYFISKDLFTTMIHEGAFVEWAEVYGEYYGTSFESIHRALDQGSDVILDIDPQGARNIKACFEDSVLVYVLPPSLEILHMRLKGRGTEEEELIKHRLAEALGEIREFSFYDYVIVNNELEEAVREAAAVVVAERCRTDRRASAVRRLFEI